MIQGWVLYSQHSGEVSAELRLSKCVLLLKQDKD